MPAQIIRWNQTETSLGTLAVAATERGIASVCLQPAPQPAERQSHPCRCSHPACGSAFVYRPAPHQERRRTERLAGVDCRGRLSTRRLTFLPCP